MGVIKEGSFVRREPPDHGGEMEAVAAELVNNFGYLLKRRAISIEGVPGDQEADKLARLIGRPARTRDVLVVGSDMTIYFALLVAENYFAAGRQVVGMGCDILYIDQKHDTGNLDDVFNKMLREISLPYFPLIACMTEVRDELIAVRWGQG